MAKAKRTNKPPGERGPNARKKNKKEDVGKSAEALMKQLKQVCRIDRNDFLTSLALTVYNCQTNDGPPFQGLSLLPLMEPSITASLNLFAPFGSSSANGKAPLKGSFGNAVLDNIPDYYSQLLTKVSPENRDHIVHHSTP